MTPVEHRRDLRQRMRMIESNLREGPKKSHEIRKDANGRLAELKREYRNSFN